MMDSQSDINTWENSKENNYEDNKWTIGSTLQTIQYNYQKSTYPLQIFAKLPHILQHYFRF